MNAVHIHTEAGLSGSVTQKIVEISRKNRELHAELARERNRTQKGQEKISELKELMKSQEVSCCSLVVETYQHDGLYPCTCTL